MSEAIRLEDLPEQRDNVTQIDATAKPLRQCVEDAMAGYFKQLEGHPTNELYKLVMAEVEEPLFRSVMQFTGGNQSKASELLGINRGTLRKKLKMYNLHN